ncbi:ATP-binding protein [Candidatus Babeliales bacterium]|nr:ATP-binding protein [Candidatus Babeliales bacterium]MCF7899621.1 ATP-binding protein [Candidatus Babeliales bacterium]
MRKELSIGTSDFKELIENNFYFADKSLFIKEIIKSGAKVVLFPRPRRFGKTLNISMLQYFFEKTMNVPYVASGQVRGDSNRHLFKDLKIEKDKECIEQQGQYPVVFFTFKDVKEENWANTFEKIRDIIFAEFNRHKYLLKSNSLDVYEKEYCKKIINNSGTQVDYENSLKKLTEYLTKCHKKKPIILIDEYDSPITAGYLNNFYSQIIDFMRGFLCGGLKDNKYLEKAVITGVLKIAKESIFSGVNNLEVYSISDEKFSEFFGFLQEEIDELLKYYNFDGDVEEVKHWYDGYNFGNNRIYNPWSIISFIRKDFKFSVYWVNTSDNKLIRDLITKGDHKLKKDIEEIVANKKNKHVINDNIVFTDIEHISEATINLLLFSGYLTVSDIQYDNIEKVNLGNLSIPNEEIASLYNNIIMYWFKRSIDTDDYKSMLDNLINGNIKEFTKYFNNFVLSSFSCFDLPENQSEKVYHAFVLGMLISLNKDYLVKSNRESGFGRYDVMLIPKNKNKLGVVIEFKKTEESETLEHATKEALEQIQARGYAQELKDLEINNILFLGIAFKGKQVQILSENNKNI